MSLVSFNSGCPIHRRRCKCSFRSGTARLVSPRASRRDVQVVKPMAPLKLDLVFDFDPFDALSTHQAASASLTRELVYWHDKVVSQHQGADKAVANFGTAILNGWWDQAVKDPSFFYTFAANVIRLKEKYTGQPDVARRLRFNAISIQELKKYITRLQSGSRLSESGHKGVGLAVALHLDFSLADGNVVESEMHATALSQIATEKYMSDVTLHQWFTFAKHATNYAISASARFPISSVLHPHLVQFDPTSTAGDQRIARYRTEALCHRLPQFMHEFQPFFNTFFRYARERNGGHDAYPVLYRLQVGLASEVADVYAKVCHLPFNFDISMTYIVLATLQLAGQAPFSFSPYSTTVVFFGWVLSVVKRLTLCLESLLGANVDAFVNLEIRFSLTWVVVVLLAHCRIAGETEKADTTDIVQTLQAVISRLDLADPMEDTMHDVLRFFPLYSEIWKAQIEHICQYLHAHHLHLIHNELIHDESTT